MFFSVYIHRPFGKYAYCFLQPQDCLPDVMISLMVNGEKVLGYGRKSARDFIYSNINIEAGQLCGKITTLLLKVFFG